LSTVKSNLEKFVEHSMMIIGLTIEKFVKLTGPHGYMQNLYNLRFIKLDFKF